jgi:hypothetical protein
LAKDINDNARLANCYNLNLALKRSIFN